MDRIEEIGCEDNSTESVVNQLIRRCNWLTDVITSQQMVINGMGVDLDSQMRLISECITRGTKPTDARKTAYEYPSNEVCAQNIYRNVLEVEKGWAEFLKNNPGIEKTLVKPGDGPFFQDQLRTPVATLSGFDSDGDIIKLEFKMDAEEARGKFTTGHSYRIVKE